MSSIIKHQSSRALSVVIMATVVFAAAAYATLPAHGATAARVGATGYARISQTGAVSHASGLSQPNLVTAGGSSYCFKGLTTTPNNVQVTLDALDKAGSNNATMSYAGLGTGGGFTGCPTGTQAFVVTVTTGRAAPNGFFVLFH